MNRILLSLAACFYFLQAYPQGGHVRGPQAATGYEIRVHLKPYTEGKVYLGYYYGKIKAIADSTLLNGSSDGIFH